MEFFRKIKLQRGSSTSYTKGSNSNIKNSYWENCIDSKKIFKVN